MKTSSFFSLRYTAQVVPIPKIQLEIEALVVEFIDCPYLVTESVGA